MADETAGGDPRGMNRYVRPVTWAVVALLVLALVASLVLEGVG